jgi:hypothetical protein
MLGGLLVYCTLLFSIDFYLMGSSIYVYMSELVGGWIATHINNNLNKGTIQGNKY